MKFQRLITALLVLCTLFATIARAPGVMLSAHEGGLTFEICTGDGAKMVSLPSGEEQPTRPDCEFFAAQTAAMVGDIPDTQIASSSVYILQSPRSQGLRAQKKAANPNLIRGPPVLS